MPREIVMHQWNVRVVGYYDVGYKCGEKMIEDEVTVYAMNKKQAKQLAEEAAKEKNTTFVFSRIKIRGRDIKKVS
jgi:hypothetical protein